MAHEPRACAQCGAEIESGGIHHRRRLFCGDECCESFEDGFLVTGGPEAVDLEEEDLLSEDLKLDEVDSVDFDEDLDLDLVDDF